MSSVSRSVYQKLKEENKRLLNDIKILTYPEKDSVERILLKGKWYLKFSEDAVFHITMKIVAKEYIKEHADELPDFLTKNIDK